MTGHPVIVARSNLPDGELFDLVANDTWDGHILGPYEYRYLEIHAGSAGSGELEER
jgi:hypothetical protein